MYITRQIEQKIVSLSKFFSVVMVCGPRQVGKTTVLQHISDSLPQKLNYVSFDNIRVRNLAKEDPELFIKSYPPPILIDEFQYATEILPYIKIAVDRSREKGQYFLTGSQMFAMMKNVSESLAGRVGILNLFSMSYSELNGKESVPFLPSNMKAFANMSSQRNVSQVFYDIYRGSMPQMITEPDLQPDDFYGAYISTYLERDIRDIINIKNERKFMRFLGCIAARTGQELIVADIAKEVEVDSKTINSWISILESSGIIFLMQPYFSNLLKRIVKRPKIYFLDTGLACYLSLWNNPAALELSAMAGAIFETYVVSEIIKSYTNAGKDPHRYLCYYRDSSQREIDLLILDNNMIYPVEIKKSANPGEKAVRHFSLLENAKLNVGTGAVICLTDDVMPLNQNTLLVPLDKI